jgi:hypothetical protein
MTSVNKVLCVLLSQLSNGRRNWEELQLVVFGFAVEGTSYYKKMKKRMRRHRQMFLKLLSAVGIRVFIIH